MVIGVLVTPTPSTVRGLPEIVSVDDGVAPWLHRAGHRPLATPPRDGPASAAALRRA
jgi:hypothetical protein